MSVLDLLAKRARQVAAGLHSEVPSPCVSICRMDPATELCEGCCRTIEEIAAWSQLDSDTKRGVWRRIAQRALDVDQQEERKP